METGEIYSITGIRRSIEDVPEPMYVVSFKDAFGIKKRMVICAKNKQKVIDYIEKELFYEKES